MSIDVFEQAIATIQAMRIQVRNDFHMSDDTKIAIFWIILGLTFVGCILW